MRKYICIAPFPPPIMGQSKVTLAVVDALYGSQFYKLDSNKSSLASGSFSFSRLTDLLKIFWRFLIIKKDSDTYTYHSVAESFLGNLRDLIIFFLNYRNLKRHYVHVLGGTSLRKIISSNSMKGSINRFFIKRLGGVIVEGSLNKSYFEKIIDSSKIHIIPNFVESYLFADDEIIKKKFQFDSNEKINILYLSNLIPGKGYVELANAFMELESSIRNNFNLYFHSDLSNGKNKSF